MHVRLMSRSRDCSARPFIESKHGKAFSPQPLVSPLLKRGERNSLSDPDPIPSSPSKENTNYKTVNVLKVNHSNVKMCLLVSLFEDVRF